MKITVIYYYPHGKQVLHIELKNQFQLKYYIYIYIYIYPLLMIVKKSTLIIAKHPDIWDQWKHQRQRVTNTV